MTSSGATRPSGPVSRRGLLGLAGGGLAWAASLPAEAVEAKVRRHAKKATAAAATHRTSTARAVPAAVRDDMVGELQTYVTDGERTLLEVAREHNIGVPHISAVNPGVDAWVTGAGRSILLPTAHILPDAPRDGIVINRTELRLYYFPKGGGVQHFSIGVGKEGLSTPMGRTSVVRKQVDPTWRPTESSFREKPWLPKVVPPGPDNPMGSYALYLGWPTYAIHGTNRIFGVGRRVSHGCIRLYPEGIERLFREIPVGARVTVVDQPVKVGWHKGELYLEVLPSLDQIDELEANYAMTVTRPAPDPRPLIEAKAGRAISRVNWDLVAAETLARRGIPVQITGPAEPALVADASEPAMAGSTPQSAASFANAATAAVPVPGGLAGEVVPGMLPGIY